MTSAAQNSKQFLAQKGAASTPSYAFLGNNTTGWYLSATNQITAATNGTAALTIDASQNVGIGTTSPGAKLEVNGTIKLTPTLNGGLQINQSGGTQTAYIGPSGFGGFALGTQTADNVILFTNNSERMRIDSSGNVGIGTTSPAVQLQVYQASSDAVERITTGTSNMEFRMVSGGTEGRISTISATPLTFRTSNAEAMRIDSSGNLLVGITSATSGGGVLQVSNGITFPATQSALANANTLDDYEEGTWTPSGTTGFPAGGAPSSITATYTKVGNMVSVRATFIGYNDGTSLYISGLPFTVSGDSAATLSNSTPNTFTYERVSGVGFYCTISGTNATNKNWYLEATYRV